MSTYVATSCVLRVEGHLLNASVLLAGPWYP